MKPVKIKLRSLRNWRDVRGLIKKNLPHLTLSGTIVVLAVLFGLRNLKPLWFEYQNAVRDFNQIYKEYSLLLDRYKSASKQGPFHQQWFPENYIRFAKLCESDTAVYQRIAFIQSQSSVRIRRCEIKRDKKSKMGFRFLLEARGDYQAINSFLRLLENEFALLSMKDVNIKSEYAESKYEGRLFAQIQGWLW